MDSNNLPGESLDLLVIGAGTAASGVARGCAKAGWKVAVTDRVGPGIDGLRRRRVAGDMERWTYRTAHGPLAKRRFAAHLVPVDVMPA